MSTITKKTGFKIWHFRSGEEHVYSVGMDLYQGSWQMSLTEVKKNPITTSTL